MKHPPLSLLALFLFASCTNVPKEAPKAMSLQVALNDVMQSLHEVKKDGVREGRTVSGLVPEEATVVLNISETSSNSRGVEINVAPPNIPATLGASASQGYDHAMANTITVKLKNIYMAPTGTPLSKWNPEEIRAHLADETKPGGLRDSILKNAMKVQTLKPDKAKQLQLDQLLPQIEQMNIMEAAELNGLLQKALE